MFKSCNFDKDLTTSFKDEELEKDISDYRLRREQFKDELEKDVLNYKIKRQQELMNERMYSKKPYGVYTSHVSPVLSTKGTPTKHDQAIMHDDKLSDESDSLTVQKILKKIPIAQKPNVRSILDKMKRSSGSWNDDGEVFIKGHLIKGSDISKIMKYFSTYNNSV